MTHAEAEPGRDLFSRRQHKYVGISVSLRDGLMEQIDQFAGEELPFLSRSAAIALLVAMGLQQWQKKTRV